MFPLAARAPVKWTRYSIVIAMKVRLESSHQAVINKGSRYSASFIAMMNYVIRSLDGARWRATKCSRLTEQPVCDRGAMKMCPAIVSIL